MIKRSTHWEEITTVTHPTLQHLNALTSEVRNRQQNNNSHVIIQKYNKTIIQLQNPEYPMLNKGYIIQKENHQGHIELEPYFRISGSNVYIYIYIWHLI